MGHTTNSNKLSGCLYLHFRGCFRSGIFFLADIPARHPIFVISLSAAFVIGLDWRLLVLIPLAFICSFAVSGSIPFLKTSTQLVNELSSFYDTFQHCRFVPVSVDDYYAAIYDDPEQTEQRLNERRNLKLRDSMLSDAEFYSRSHLRFIQVDAKDTAGPRLGMAAAFVGMDRAWIFLNCHPRDMNGFQKFALLHEVGHTEMTAHLNFDLKGVYTPFWLSLPLLAIMTLWSASALIVLVSILAVVFWSYSTIRSQRSYTRLHDETYADLFALSHCKKEWLSDYPAGIIADAFCSMLQPKLFDPSLKLDPPMTEAQATLRQNTFTSNVERIRRGEPPTDDGFDPMGPLFTKNRNFRLIQAVLLVCGLVILGLHHGELTTLRFVGVTATLILLTITGLICLETPKLWLNFWDKQFGSKELTPAEKKNLDTFIKSNEAFAPLREKGSRITKMWKKTAADKADVYILAAGVSERLFMPRDVNLYIDKQTLDAFIYHDKIISYDISHILYIPTDHSLIVVMNDDTRFDLGVKLGPVVRPYFLRVKEINIMRTENGEPMESVTVPFWKVIETEP